MSPYLTDVLGPFVAGGWRPAGGPAHEQFDVVDPSTGGTDRGRGVLFRG